MNKYKGIMSDFWENPSSEEAQSIIDGVLGSVHGLLDVKEVREAREAYQERKIMFAELGLH